MSDVQEKAGWKQKLIHEMTEYWINFIYLALFFGVFTTYRRLILTEYQIGYEEYGIALIKALVLAKVVMLGDILKLGRRLEDGPLIFPTLYKAVVFTLWVMLFSVIEATAGGLLHGKGLTGGFAELTDKGWHELLARCLVVFAAFIPFFAFRELERALGEGTIRDSFMKRKSAAAAS